MGRIFSHLLHGLRKAVQFSGRDNRSQFWIYTACVFTIVLAVFSIWASVSSRRLFEQLSTNEISPHEISTTLQNQTLVPIVMLIFALAAAVSRRLHDIGKSATIGLPTALLLLSGYLVFMIATQKSISDDENSFFLGWIAVIFIINLLYLISLIYLGVSLGKRGTTGENRFGPAPSNVLK